MSLWVVTFTPRNKPWMLSHHSGSPSHTPSAALRAYVEEKFGSFEPAAVFDAQSVGFKFVDWNDEADEPTPL